MEITINVPELKELSEAIKTLSSTLGYNKSELTEQAVQNAQIEPQTMTTSLPATESNVVSPVPVSGVSTNGVPVDGMPAYDPMQLAQAAATFADKGDNYRKQILSLINSYGVPTITALPADKLGEFATQLRGLGAVI